VTGPASSRRIVLVEDDEAFRQSVEHTLSLADYEVEAFGDAASAEAYLSAHVPGIVLTDLRLPGQDGLYVLECAHRRDPALPVIVMTGHGDVPTAIQAIRAGAYDFLEKPFSRDHLLAVLARATDKYALAAENHLLKRQLAATSGIEQILCGESAAMKTLRDWVVRLAPTSADVLVNGETGTGKELVARCLHDFSKRRGNFVALNCAAIPETLFESELFGHESGAFTGAGKQRMGRIEHANDGTLFLDEIEAMPLGLQAKLLRVLQEREIERLGNNRPIPVDFRVVAATKVSLEELTRKGAFRADLFYRLEVANLRVPALRDRVSDVLQLFRTFQQQAALRFQMPAQPLTAEQHQALLAWRWPGNVRELKSCAERFVLGMPIFVDGAPDAIARRSFEESVALIERSLLEESLSRHGGSAKAACAELELTSATFYRKAKALGIDPASFRRADAGDEK
jgi:DNA-binding NtrC family response regulator